MRKYLSITFTFLLASSCLLAQGGNSPLITVFENGNGSLLFPGSPSVNLPGVLAPDPGPGGLAAALTFNLLGPPSLVAGDLLIDESVGSTVVLSDVVRFNPAGTGAPAYPASLIFYSDKDDPPPLLLADTGLPTAHYANTFSVLEGLIAPGLNGAIYTPTANQPGFVAGFNVTYDIVSDTVTPEPVSASFFVIAAGMMFAGKRWLRVRAN